MAGEAAQATVDQAVQAEGNGNREKRSRDRYGRDRGGRGERGDRGGRGPREELPQQAEPAPVTPEGIETERPAEPARAAPVAAPARAPVQAAPATRGLPRVQPFALPMDELSQVAQSSGLQWVNSDASKVAMVQAAIAAEPKPVHVPRARPAPIVIDEGPLILVETRRDLRNLPLPMEQSGTAP
jgi:ribonuclease E